MDIILEYIKNHKYYLTLGILVFTSIVLSVTYSNYFVSSGNHRVAEMYIGALKYSMKIDSNETNTLTLEPGETIIDIDVNNLNPVDTYYKLLYLNNSNLTINYYSQTKDTSDVVTKYNKPNDSITSSGTNNIKLSIINNSSSNQTISFSLKGGYINNTLSDISVPSGYSEIDKEDTSTNTYFCYTDSTLEQGTTYSDSIFAYAYKQQLIFNIQANRYAWNNSDVNGWGVGLNDRTTTDSIVAKMCTYINNKPIKLMNYAFNNSAASSIDLSGVNSKNVVDMSFAFNTVNSLINLDKLVTNNVTNMSYMFYGIKMTSLDLSSLDTSKVTNMSYMFTSSKLTSINLSSFNTSNVVNMQSMFYGSQATSINLNNFDTSKVTNMGNMFSNTVLTSIDLSSFNTSKVTNMSSMFSNSAFTSLDLSNFDTSSVTNMNSMFSGSKLISLNLNNFNTSKVTNMGSMFFNSELTSLDLSNFNTSNVTNMSSMFSGSKLTSLNLSNFDTSKVTNMGSMFYNSNLNVLDISNFNTSNVTSMSSMFSNTKITSLDLSSFDTSKVKSMLQMFYNSSNLKIIYVSDKFNTTATTNSRNMFSNCSSLVGGSGTAYDSNNIDKTYAIIDGGTSSPGYFTDESQKPSTFDTDSLATVVKSIKAGNTRHYKVGDTKEIDLGTTYGTHTIRVANTSTPSECSTEGFSQTACGFVLEFADLIVEHNMNPTGIYSGNGKNYIGGWNTDGWPASQMRTFINNDIYNSLPTDLKNGIIDTIAVSSYGSDNTSNFVSTDKLYLLSTAEVYAQGGRLNIDADSARDVTRQLDYYESLGVNTNSATKAIKYQTSLSMSGSQKTGSWYLRSAVGGTNTQFYAVTGMGWQTKI